MHSRSLGSLVFALALLVANFGMVDGADASKKKPAPATSPKQVWPPKGFKERDGVFAKVPTTNELIGYLSAKRSLQKYPKGCETNKVACGYIFVAAESGCTWWEINSSVRKLNAETLTKERIGTILTYAKGTDKEEMTVIFLVSTEPAGVDTSVGNIKVICHREKTNIPKPGNIYTPIAIKEN